MKWCAQCRAGGSQIEADWYVEGMAWTSGAARAMPYRANLCSDHKYLLEEEGAKWRRWQRFARSVPNGTNRKANEEAMMDGDTKSPRATRYVYRAVAQHNGRDACLVHPGGCQARTAEECRRLATAATRVAFRVRRYRVGGAS